jgi:hypothetical protein
MSTFKYTTVRLLMDAIITVDELTKQFRDGTTAPRRTEPE